MTTYYIEPSRFYILSGLSGSGKSTFLSKMTQRGQIDASAVVCPDTIRKNILGTQPRLDSYGVYQTLPGWDIANKEAFDIAFKILETRFKNGLITFFDATSLDDKARQPLVQLASHWGMRSQIIIFDTPIEEAKANLLRRAERFAPEVLDRQAQHLQKTSAMPYILYRPGVDEVVLTPALITTNKLDIIGDTHGLLEDTLVLLQKFGWTLNQNTKTFEHTDAERKLFFVGDVVDRGPESWELLALVKNTVVAGKAYFVLGNHEHKLFRLMSDYEAGAELQKRSLAGALSFKKYLKLSPEKQKEMYRFLKYAPSSYSLWFDKKLNKVLSQEEAGLALQTGKVSHIQKFGFAHADIQYFNDYLNLKSQVLYGIKERLNDNTVINNDIRFDELTDEGINSHIYIRGHLPLREPARYVFSLDDRCAFAGHIKALNFEAYLNDFQKNNYVSTQAIFEIHTVEQKVKFNFNEYLKTIDIDKETDLTGIQKPKNKKEKEKQLKNAKNKL